MLVGQKYSEEDGRTLGSCAILAKKRPVPVKEGPQWRVVRLARTDRVGIVGDRFGCSPIFSLGGIWGINGKYDRSMLLVGKSTCNSDDDADENGSEDKASQELADRGSIVQHGVGSARGVMTRCRLALA